MSSIVDYMLIKKATLRGIGDAIRTKKGTTELIPVNNMATEIESIQGTSTIRGGCTIPVGGKFSFNYGGLENVSVYRPSCVTYTTDGEYLVFTAVSAGSGTVTVVSGSTTLLAYTVTVQAAGSDTTTCSHPTFTSQITKNATCSAVGRKAYTCSTCFTTWSEDIPKLDHTWSDPYYSSTDFTSGYGMKCTVCGEKTEGACPHTNKTSNVTVDPTCMSTGVRTYTCVACGKELSTETIPKTAHYLLDDWTVITEATCTRTGSQRRNCHNDNCSYFEEQSIPKTTHVWSENPVEYGDGYAYECTICGAYNPIPDETCEHTPEVTGVVTPTCTSGGYTTYKCSSCGYEWNADYTEKLGHAYASVVTAPTCTSGGYTTYTCSRCLDSYEDDKKAATGHTDGDPVLSNKPTCNVCAKYEVRCKSCGTFLYEYTDDGVFGDHVFSTADLTQEPTCTEAGYDYNYCDVCFDRVITKIGDPALGHEWVLEKNSAFSNGYGYVCSRCGELGAEGEGEYDCSILGHDTDDGAYDIDGEAMYLCKHCGEYYPV